jgi:hypothetical protein
VLVCATLQEFQTHGKMAARSCVFSKSIACIL